MITFDANLLLSYYQARSGVSGGGAASASNSASQVKSAPTAPWSSRSAAPEGSELLRGVLAGRSFINASASKTDVAGASTDYRNLFTAYQALDTLSALAGQAGRDNVSSIDLRQYQKAFDRGLSEVSSYLGSAKFENIDLSIGKSQTKAVATVGVKQASETYVSSAVLATGSTSTVSTAFQGDVRFKISVTPAISSNPAFDVDIDLSALSADDRNLNKVVEHINTQLEAAGAVTRFSVLKLPSKPNTVTVGEKTITLPTAPDQWTWKVEGNSLEAVRFSAPDAADAVFVAQSVGAAPKSTTTTVGGIPTTTTEPDTTQRQILKLQTDDAATATAPPAVPLGNDLPNWVEGQAFSKTLDSDIAAVNASAAGPDGSVYQLVTLKGAVDGQSIKGAQDVALQKYDSAGTLIYTRTLGAAQSATGFALAVSDDGQVAVAGSVVGGLIEGRSGDDAAKSDSFVTVFDDKGQELWTQRRSARDEDEAQAVTFGDDGQVYVAGRTRSVLPGAGAALGGWDAYLQGFSSDLSGTTPVVSSLFTTQFGGAGSDAASDVAVEGSSLVTAGIENGRVVVRSFTLDAAGVATAAGERDLGEVAGGSIAGISLKSGVVTVAGTTLGAGLEPAVASGVVNGAYSGGADVFVARLSGDLAAGPGDRLSYFGGSGADTVSAVAFTDDKVYLAGSSTAELPGLAALGTRDGFVASLNADTGAVDWSRRFSAKDGQAAPSAIAVTAGGASVLDRLGLPQGEIGVADSQRITANSAVRAGDQFQIQVGSGRKATVTVEAKDTLETLAVKIRRAAGFNINVDVYKPSPVLADDDDEQAAGFAYLRIQSRNPANAVEITAGKGGRDALEALGLSEGTVRTLPVGKTEAQLNLGKVYGLNLDSSLSLSDKDAVKVAADRLKGALSVLRTAYLELDGLINPKPKSASKGAAPAYLTAQIANYQAGLDRLTGGG